MSTNLINTINGLISNKKLQDQRIINKTLKEFKVNSEFELTNNDRENFIARLEELMEETNDDLGSKNVKNGFYGTFQRNHELSNEDMEHHFSHARKLMSRYHGLSRKESRNFLDSGHGRHLADLVDSSSELEHLIKGHKDIRERVKKFKNHHEPSLFEQRIAKEN